MLRSGQARVVVFVGASTCSASRYPGLPSALAKVRRDRQAQAAPDSVRLWLVGIAPQWDIRAGTSFLDGFGPFDEIVAGRNWLNTGATLHMASDRNGMAIPQVLVLQRHVQVDTLGVRFSNARVLTPIIGAKTIASWADSAAVVERQ